MKIVVVGGGIAGLAAARRLESTARDVDVVLLENNDVLGGKIQTERVDGFVIEAAPDSFLSRKERGVGLCEELGLGDELIGRRPENHRSFVRRGRDLHPLPEGLTGMIPTSLDALERSALLSDEGKARFAAETDVPAASGDDDESVASFVTRRFGREAYEGLVEPLMTGIYGGDGELLSLRATFPQLRDLEREHGSLLRSLPAQSVTGDRPPFVSLRGGMDTLVAALGASLGRTRLLLGRPAQRVFARAGGYDVELADGETIRARRGRRCDSCFRDGGAPRGAGRRSRRRPRRDPVRVVGGRHAGVLVAGSSGARRLRLRDPAHGEPRRARMHVVVAEVGGPRSRR